MSNIAVSCRHITKSYPIYNGNKDKVKALFLPHFKPQEFLAIKDLSFDCEQGEIIGLVGLNGSGKSTISTIISGITFPTSGELIVDGEVGMLSVGAGMESLLTGIENIRYKCLLMGMDKAYAASLEQEIIEFADIGLHINQPVRTYSSGMRSRLGFSIAIHMNPDILIIDEALSVGDSSFADKCMEKMNELRTSGKTIIYVSHNVPSMKGFCNRVVWLHHGQMVGYEKTEDIVDAYLGFAREFNKMTAEEKKASMPELKVYQEKYCK